MTARAPAAGRKPDRTDGDKAALTSRVRADPASTLVCRDGRFYALNPPLRPGTRSMVPSASTFGPSSGAAPGGALRLTG